MCRWWWLLLAAVADCTRLSSAPGCVLGESPGVLVLCRCEWAPARRGVWCGVCVCVCRKKIPMAVDVTKGRLPCCTLYNNTVRERSCASEQTGAGECEGSSSIWLAVVHSRKYHELHERSVVLKGYKSSRHPLGQGSLGWQAGRCRRAIGYVFSCTAPSGHRYNTCVWPLQRMTDVSLLCPTDTFRCISARARCTALACTAPQTEAHCCSRGRFRIPRRPVSFSRADRISTPTGYPRPPSALR